MISLMRKCVPDSTPLEMETSVASLGKCGAQRVRLSRMVWLGTPKTTIAAFSSASAAFEVA